MASTKFESRYGSSGDCALPCTFCAGIAPSPPSRLLGHVVLVLRHRQCLVVFARGAGGRHVNVVGVDIRADAEVRQVAGQRGDVGRGLAVGAGELADRQVVPDAVARPGLQEPTFRSRRMNDTVSGVLAGVLPKTDAPGSCATLMPDATGSGVFGFWSGGGRGGPASAARGVMTAATPSTTAADSRVFLMRIMSCAPSYEACLPRLVAVSRGSTVIMPVRLAGTRPLRADR